MEERVKEDGIKQLETALSFEGVFMGLGLQGKKLREKWSMGDEEKDCEEVGRAAAATEREDAAIFVALKLLQSENGG